MRRLFNKKGYTLLMIVLLSAAILALAVGIFTVAYQGDRNYTSSALVLERKVQTENQANEYLYTNSDFISEFQALAEGERLTKLFDEGLLTVTVEKQSNKMKIVEWIYKG